MPHQHHHSDGKDAGVEQFLAGALERLRYDAGECRDNGRADDAGADADGDPAAAAVNTARCGHDDADDEAGFEDFAKDNNECAKHDVSPPILFYSAMTTPLAVAS